MTKNIRFLLTACSVLHSSLDHLLHFYNKHPVRWSYIPAPCCLSQLPPTWAQQLKVLHSLKINLLLGKNKHGHTSETKIEC